MSTIDLNLSRKVDITCRANDTLHFTIGATDEEGNALSFNPNDEYYFFTIYDSQKEPVMILSTTRLVHFESDIVIFNLTYGSANTQIIQMRKNAYAVQKLLNSSRIITANAFNDMYHPNSIVDPTIGIGSQVGSLETSEKMWFKERHQFIRSTVSDPNNLQHVSTVAINYQPDKKQFVIFVDAAAFTLPPNRYLYDLKSASQLFTPIDQYEGVEMIEESVFESSNTLIYGSFTVKKD
jgi:hypothetical protein